MPAYSLQIDAAVVFVKVHSSRILIRSIADLTVLIVTILSGTSTLLLQLLVRIVQACFVKVHGGIDKYRLLQTDCSNNTQCQAQQVVFVVGVTILGLKMAGLSRTPQMSFLNDIVFTLSIRLDRPKPIATSKPI
jgi:H+/Cl- antiporter ClcA